MTPYLRPNARQRRLLVALIQTGTVRAAAAQLGISVDAANGMMAEARKRSGMHTAALIAAGVRDGWLVEVVG